VRKKRPGRREKVFITEEQERLGFTARNGDGEGVVKRGCRWVRRGGADGGGSGIGRRMACYGVFTGGARGNLHTEHLSPAP